MDNKDSILILGAGIYQVPLIKKAQELGLRAVITSIPGNYPGFAAADKVYYANTTDKDAVLDIARSERVAAVTTTGTDVAVSSIGYVCRELGLCGISEQAARVLTDKALMKEAFVNGGVTTAEFRRVESYEEAVAAAEELGLPVMLKIVDKSGSRGITKITDLSRMREAYDYALAATDADHMVVERFVDGREVGIDALVQNGRLLLMLPHEKYVYHSGHTGIPEVISGYTGRDYYSCIIDAALGRPIVPFDLTHGTPTASQLLYTERSGILREIRYRFAGREYVNENAVVPGAGKVEVSFAPGDDIDAFRNGTDRIGQAIFQAASNDELQAAVKSFRESLRVEVCQ